MCPKGLWRLVAAVLAAFSLALACSCRAQSSLAVAQQQQHCPDPSNCNPASTASITTAHIYTASSPAVDALSANSNNGQAYIAFCAVVRDQNDDIREWVQYHQWLGVSKFYIHDHNSSKPLILELQDWVDSGLVEYHRFEKPINTSKHRKFCDTPQGHAYEQCLSLARNRHHWMAFIDPDEFVVMNDPAQKLPDVAKEFEPYGGLLMHWRLFGSSGHVSKPSAPTMLAYTKCRVSSQVKSMVNVQFVEGLANNPHVFLYKPGYYAVTDQKERCDKPFCPAGHTKLSLHHYVLKSLEEYRRKKLRGGGAGGSKPRMFWQSIEITANETCLQAVPAAKACFGAAGHTAGTANS